MSNPPAVPGRHSQCVDSIAPLDKARHLRKMGHYSTCLDFIASVMAAAALKSPTAESLPASVPLLFEFQLLRCESLFALARPSEVLFVGLALLRTAGGPGHRHPRLTWLIVRCLLSIYSHAVQDAPFRNRELLQEYCRSLVYLMAENTCSESRDVRAFSLPLSLAIDP
jgi:hypothetical protein